MRRRDIQELKESKLIRFIYFLIFPFFLAIWLLPYSPVDFSFEKQVNSTYITIPKESIEYPIWKSSIRRVFSSPFDLNYYKIVIEDTSTTNNVSICEPEWNITIGDKNKLVKHKSKIYFDMIQIEEDYNWNKEVTLYSDLYELEKRGCEISFGFIGYAKPYFTDMIAKWFLFIVSFIGLNFLGYKTCSVIRNRK